MPTTLSNRHLLLTNRELEVLALIAKSNSTNDIGKALGISPRTADTHRSTIMRKLDLHDASALTRYALAIGLVVNEFA